jgi:hypothetical protein
MDEEVRGVTKSRLAEAPRSIHKQSSPAFIIARRQSQQRAFRIGQDVAMITNPTLLGIVEGFDPDGSVMVRWHGGAAVSGVNPNNLRGLPPGYARESRRPVVRDYIAVDPKGRTIAGPFTSYSDAKREAARAHGYVRFASGARDRRR